MKEGSEEGSLDAIPAAQWNELAGPGKGILSHEFLRPSEHSLTDFRWNILVHRSKEERALAHYPAFEHRYDLHAMVPRRLQSLARSLGCLVMELGHPCAPAAAFLSRGPSCAEALHGIWDHFQSHSRAAMLIVRDVPLGDPMEAPLRAQGFWRIASRPTFVVPTTDRDFESYLAAMKASHRRRAKRWLESPLEVELVSDFAHLADEMARLFALNASRSKESRTEIIDPQLIRDWSKHPKTAALIVRHGSTGEQAIALFMSDAPVLHFLRCGFDRSEAQRHGLYFRLLFELVRIAFEQGCSSLDLGVTSADPKLRLGAQCVELGVWARHRHAALNRGLRWLSGPWLARASSPAIEHRVFKTPRESVVPSWYRASL